MQRGKKDERKEWGEIGFGRLSAGALVDLVWGCGFYGKKGRAWLWRIRKGWE